MRIFLGFCLAICGLISTSIPKALNYTNNPCLQQYKFLFWFLIAGGLFVGVYGCFLFLEETIKPNDIKRMTSKILEMNNEKRELHSFILSGVKVESGHPEEDVRLRVNLVLGAFGNPVRITNVRTGEKRYFFPDGLIVKSKS